MPDFADSIRALVRDLVRDEVSRALAELRTSDRSSTVSVKTYAAEREIGQSTVRRAIADGRLAHVRVGHSVRVPADATISPVRDTPAARAEQAWERLNGRDNSRTP
jgi:excisionase family DNA binding protein